MVDNEQTNLLLVQDDLRHLTIGHETFPMEREESCSDSGKGGSEILTPADSIVNEGGSEIHTPAESINESTDSTAAAPWHVCAAYNAFTAYSPTMGALMPCHAMIYEFEIPQCIVGRLIGKYGSFVNRIKGNTGANIIIKKHHKNTDMKICAIEGLCGEIEEAIGMIRERFPMKRYPCLRLEQLNHQRRIPGSTAISFLPPNNKLHLIEGVVNDVSISCVINVNHIFVQQPTHPTFPALSRLHKALKSFYEQTEAAPKLIRPFNAGVICVARLEGDWFRAEVVSLDEEGDEVTIRLVDGGGYACLPIEELRQIRFDFVTIPFQGTECRLAGIGPINPAVLELGQDVEAYVDSICQGQVLQAHVAGYSLTTNETLIYLYRMGEDQVPVLVNQELVELGLATWVSDTATLEPISFETDAGAVSPYELMPSDESSTSMDMDKSLNLEPSLSPANDVTTDTMLNSSSGACPPTSWESTAAVSSH